jgi:hypothetical protein
LHPYVFTHDGEPARRKRWGIWRKICV